MAMPPFNPDEAIPEDDDIISQYPAIARTFRDIMESWMLINHDRNGNHTAIGLADLVGLTPPGLTNIARVWQETGKLFTRINVGGTINVIPQHVYDAFVPGIPNSAMMSMASGTLKGRAAGSAGVPQDLTPAQAAVIIPIFTPATATVVGIKGSVPPPPIGASLDGLVLDAAGDWVNVGAPHVILQDQKAINVQGGTFTSGSWRRRDITTEVHDPHGLTSILETERFTLPAGTYVIKWSAPAFAVGAHVTRLFNVSNSTEVAAGTPEHTGTADATGAGSASGATTFVQTRSIGTAKVTITSTESFAIEHRSELTRANNGFGITDFGLAPTVYTQVDVWKVG